MALPPESVRKIQRAETLVDGGSSSEDRLLPRSVGSFLLLYSGANLRRSGKTEGQPGKTGDTGKDQNSDTWVSTPRVDFASATTDQERKCPLDPPKGGENEGSAGDQMVTIRTDQRTTSIAQEYLCCCGRGFATERGMKIHRTKMGCLKSMTPSNQRTESSDESSGVLCQESKPQCRECLGWERQVRHQQFPQ